MLVQLCNEQVHELTRNDLKETYESLLSDYRRCCKEKKSVNFFSDIYIEEKKEFIKYLKAYSLVLDFSGVIHEQYNINKDNK